MPEAPIGSAEPIRVVVICTANRCRSPLAAAILRSRLAARGVPAVVEAYGLSAPGLAATRQAIAVAARHDLDLREHASRRLDADALIALDLALGMERGHVRAATVIDPSIWPQTFTLRELVRRAEAIGARADDESLHAWLARVHEGREPRDLLGESPDDDVTDPTGGTTAEHEDLAVALEELVDRLVVLAWPDA